jgi:peptide/nickel transport system substrate-binding protein
MKRLASLVLIVMAVSLAVACGPTPEPQTIVETVEVEKEVTVVETVEVEKEVTVVETVEVEKEVTVVETVEVEKEQPPVIVAIGVAIPTMDPHKQSTNAYESILRNMYEALVVFGPDLNIEPQLATSWKRIDEYTLQFKLRKGVQFHNGEPFDARAVKASIERMLDPATESPWSSTYSMIERVDIVDDYVVNVVTNIPDPILLRRMSGFGTTIMAPEYIATASAEELATMPIGTGPYKFVSWEKDGDLVMEANTEYWGVVPAVKKAVVRAIPETGTRVSALLAGEVDIVAVVPPEDVDRIDESGIARAEDVEGNRIFYYTMDFASEPTSNKLFRQAINYGANIDGIIEAVLNGGGYRRATLLNPWHSCYNPDIEPFPYDPEKAKDLLAQAGYADGVDLSMHLVSGRVVKDKEVGEAIAGELEKIGIRPQITWHEFASYVDLAVAGKLDGLIFASWGNALHDADQAFYVLFHSDTVITNNFNRGYANDELDALLEAGRSETDEDKRCALYDQVQEILMDDCPGLFGFSVQEIYGVNNRIEWRPRSDEMIWFKEMSFRE